MKWPSIVRHARYRDSKCTNNKVWNNRQAVSIRWLCKKGRETANMEDQFEQKVGKPENCINKKHNADVQKQCNAGNADNAA